MSIQDGFKGQIGFAVGTGRCGTKFISQAIGFEPDVSSVHERNVLNESFHRYCKWYDLPVDDEGFLQAKEMEIREDLKGRRFSFEASAQLSFSIRELYGCFGAKFILLARSPELVVNSFVRKGLYDRPFISSDCGLAPGYQRCQAFHHFLGRIGPHGEKLLQWNQMSQVGRIAWYWNAVNERVLDQFHSIPDTHWKIETIEGLSYDRYLEIAQFLGFQGTIAEEAYENLVQSRPNALIDVPTITKWTAREVAEFEAEVEPMAKRLGYEYRVRNLPVPHQGSLSSNSQDNSEKVSCLEKRSYRGSRLSSYGCPRAPNWWEKILFRFRS